MADTHQSYTVGAVFERVDPVGLLPPVADLQAREFAGQQAFAGVLQRGRQVAIRRAAACLQTDVGGAGCEVREQICNLIRCQQRFVHGRQFGQVHAVVVRGLFRRLQTARLFFAQQLFLPGPGGGLRRSRAAQAEPVAASESPFRIGAISLVIH